MRHKRFFSGLGGLIISTLVGCEPRQYPPTEKLDEHHFSFIVKSEREDQRNRGNYYFTATSEYGLKAFEILFKIPEANSLIDPGDKITIELGRHQTVAHTQYTIWLENIVEVNDQKSPFYIPNYYSY